VSQEDFLSEEEATRLWKRAAEIQAEASRQAELAAANEAARELGSGDTPGGPDGYALTHVRAAAVEAGIGDEFVAAALSDLRAEQAAGGGSRGARLARRLIGNPDAAITVSRVINAPTAKVLQAMESVMPGEPFGLVLRDRRGNPAAGGLLLFDIPGSSMTGVQQPGFLGQASIADLREIYASLRPMGETACELTLRGPIAWAFGFTSGIATVVTGAGGGIGFAVGSTLAAVLGGAAATMGMGAAAAVIAGVMVVSGIGGGAGLGHFAFRKIYQYGLGRGETALENVLSAVAVEAEGGWGFSGKSLPENTSAEG